MGLEQDIVARLLADKDIVAVISNRIAPEQEAQVSALAGGYVVYRRPSGAPLQALDGPTDTTEEQIILTCWDESYKKAKTLGGLVRASLDGWEEAGMVLDDEYDEFVPASDDSEKPLNGVTLEFTALYS